MLQLCLRLLRSAAKALARVQQPKLHLEQLLEQENLGFGAGKSKFVAGYDKKCTFILEHQIPNFKQCNTKDVQTI